VLIRLRACNTVMRGCMIFNPLMSSFAIAFNKKSIIISPSHTSPLISL
jgi:hypothetical protein